MKKILFIASGLLLASQVQAAPGCTAANLNGSYVMFQNSVAPQNLHIGRCEMTVLNGQVFGSCAFTSPGVNGGQATPGFSGSVSGVATMNQNCSADVEIDFSPAPGVTVQSFFDLQFSPDKQSFVGQWTNSFGLLGTTAGTRYAPNLPATPAP